MKKIFLFTLLIICFGCEMANKKEKKTAPVVKPPNQIEAKGMPDIYDNTLIELKKKPCSGDCPVFEVSITRDSILTYNGIQYTNIEGIHTLKLSGKQFSKLSQILESANFLELESEYATSGTKDFAETTLTYNGKSVMVRLWKDAPKELTNIYVFIEDILYDNKYLE